MKTISASIDLTKIDKSKIVNHTNGCKYLNIDIYLNDEKNKYGQDTSIAISQTKEERAAKTKRIYLGNGKTVFESDKNKSTDLPPVPNTTNQWDAQHDYLPF